MAKDSDISVGDDRSADGAKAKTPFVTSEQDHLKRPPVTGPNQQRTDAGNAETRPRKSD